MNEFHVERVRWMTDDGRYLVVNVTQAEGKGILAPDMAIDPLAGTQDDKEQTNRCHHRMA